MLSKLRHFEGLSRNISLNNTRYLATTKTNVAKAEKNSIRGLENEPSEPIVKTQIPGPKSKKLIGDLSKMQVNFLIFLLWLLINMVHGFLFLG